MALRIAFDMDGVFADMEAELARRAEALFGEAVARRSDDQANSSGDAADAATPQADGESAQDEAPPLSKLMMNARQQRRLWRHVESIENFWETLEEIEPGSVARLAAIVAERRWEVIFLTKRPKSAGVTAQVQSQRWLEAKGFLLPSVFVVQRSRGRIAEALALDIVVDDRPENCLDILVDSKARAILVWRDDPKGLPVAARRLGIGVVKSVMECLDVLMKIDSPTDEKTSLLDRMKRLLGLKEANV